MSINIRNLSNLDFESYYQLRSELDRTGDKPNDVIGQHDNDLVTFDSAYSVIHRIVTDIMTANSGFANVNADMVGVVVEALMNKGIFTKEDYNYIVTRTQHYLELDEKEAKENGIK